MNVWVEEEKMWGLPYILYRVMVDGKEYDRMSLLLINNHPLTWSQQQDIADGYKEALDES